VCVDTKGAFYTQRSGTTAVVFSYQK